MLALVIPIVIWSVTGSYFVLMDINFIRGDYIGKQSVVHIDAKQIKYPISAVYQRYPDADEISLKRLASQHYYRIELKGKVFLLNANSGQLSAEITEPQAREIAKGFQHQQSIPLEAKLIKVVLLREKGPAELAARHLPVWQMDFDDSAATTLYLSATTGELVTRRHDYWRLFDLFWKWHIMDYDDGESIDNKLLLFTAILAIISVIAGLLLTWQRRRRYL
ncbi:peptidase [Shewanella sp. KX20019]|uniref:peptidase n=1 Tax=Shewanella sp. KX20019 TaxID=2803864 RepID=UPI001925B3AD|nr:peptidase [Shewanella sp. KX20019]QQX79784.1 peptidase [Shewanella sp. KX20019]